MGPQIYIHTIPIPLPVQKPKDMGMVFFRPSILLDLYWSGLDSQVQAPASENAENRKSFVQKNAAKGTKKSSMSSAFEASSTG